MPEGCFFLELLLNTVHISVFLFIRKLNLYALTKESDLIALIRLKNEYNTKVTQT